MKLVECVPNFSEGRDKSVIDAISKRIKSIEGVVLLDVDSGIDTNRTVMTMVGDPKSISNAAFEAIKVASDLIDMSKHHGSHSRIGATDVCPIIPISEISIKECIELSENLAKRVGEELNIPVFLYEKSAKDLNRVNLANIRKGEYEGLAQKLNDIKWKPDFGPSTFNKKSGATVIGVRDFLIAYNINLNTTNVRIATDIAFEIREKGRSKRKPNPKSPILLDGEIIRDKKGAPIKKSGLFKDVKAVGWYVDEFKCAQISINFNNYKKSTIHEVFDKVCDLANERGVQPIAELLGTTIANSAYHGTRLDVEHVAQTVDKFVTSMEQKWDINRHKIAPNTVFFSHETYTPARGGSAQSEVKALRSTFGDSANSLVIANTKGFTGHPMAVGIEDASMLYGMLTGKIPPIANHQEKDPELGDLNLSTGGYYPNLEYGLRFGAGFGSQIALSLVRKWQVDGDRIDGKKLINWVRNLAGSDDVVIRILDGKLVSYVDGNDNLHGGIQGDEWSVTQLHETIETPEMANLENQQPEATVVENTEQHESNQIESLTSEEKLVVNEDEVVTTVIQVVVKHTGYPADFVELDQDLEGELGIDTVKQAEIMAEIRSIFGLPVDEDFVLADYPTLNHMIGYIGRMSGNLETVGEAIAAPVIAVDEVVEAVPPHESKISAAPAVDD